MSNYIVKISRAGLVNQIYWSRVYYTKLRRDWAKESKIVFITKTWDSDEAFVGLGKIKMIYELSALDTEESKDYIKNSYYSKIEFGTMVRFLPAIVTRRKEFSSFSTTKRPLLDGAYLSDSEVSMIELLAKIAIIY
jgi:hypothetical protein